MLFKSLKLQIDEELCVFFIVKFATAESLLFFHSNSLFDDDFLMCLAAGYYKDY